MTLNKDKQGFSLIGGIFVVACLAAAAYFISPVWRDKMNVTAEDITTWTPEKVMTNSVPYIRARQQEIVKLHATLHAQQIQLIESLVDMESQYKASNHHVEVGNRELATLATTIKANPNESIQWNNRTWGPTEATAQLINLDQQLIAEQSAAAKFESLISRMKARQIDLQEQALRAQNVERELELALVEAVALQDNPGMSDSVSSKLGDIERNLRLLSTDIDTGSGVSLKQLADSDTTPSSTQASSILDRY
jgi:hypothetical protein